MRLLSEIRTSRDAARQKEQLDTFRTMPALTQEQVDEIAEAGNKRFFRHFQRKIWDVAKP